MKQPLSTYSLRPSLAAPDLLPCGLQEIEQIRLLLQGDSVLDWRKLAFIDADQVERFLHTVGFRKDNAADEAHLIDLYRRAVQYTEGHLGYTLCEQMRSLQSVRDLFLYASRPSRDRLQRDACTLLKVMHILHYVIAQELLYKLPVSRNDLFFRVETRAYEAIDALKATGVRLVEFAGSRKTPDSILTKLLCRKGPLGSEVYDRLRFRVITETSEELFQALVFLTQTFIPFSYVVPGETRNDLIDLLGTLRTEPPFFAYEGALQTLPPNPLPPPVNKFSASNFAVINFVADVPVWVDDLVARMPGYSERDGRVVFLLFEMQLVDRITAENNEKGEGRHDLYKERQRLKAIERLDN